MDRATLVRVGLDCSIAKVNTEAKRTPKQPGPENSDGPKSLPLISSSIPNSLHKDLHLYKFDL